MNRNLSFDFILENPDKNWDFINIIQNTMDKDKEKKINIVKDILISNNVKRDISGALKILPNDMLYEIFSWF